MNAGPDVDLQRWCAPQDGKGRFDRGTGSREGHEVTVAGAFDQPASEAGDLDGDELVQMGEQLFPPGVAQLGGDPGGVHHVGEQDRADLPFSMLRDGSAQELGVGADAELAPVERP